MSLVRRPREEICIIVKTALIDRDIESLDEAQRACAKLLFDDIIESTGLIEPVEPPSAQAIWREMRSKETRPVLIELKTLLPQLDERVKRITARYRKPRPRER